MSTILSMQNQINTLPCEIIDNWVHKINSQVCKLWFTIWCAKSLIISSYNCWKSCPSTVILKFSNLWCLDLRKIPIDFPIEKLTRLKVLSIYDNSIANRSLKHLTNLTKL